MEYFTAMVIAYTLRDVPFEAIVYYENERKCSDAMMAGADFYKTIYKSERDSHISCIPTEIASASPSPKLRPNNLQVTK